MPEPGDTASVSHDEAFMAQAIEAAREARLRSSPNPWVGALVVRDGEVVGSGATEEPGGRHGEIVALEEAGERAKGATVYVTLEPCAHEGRTGPCSLALVRAGVARVVVGVLDPDEHVAGRGVAELEREGVTVATGVLERAVEAQLAPYLHHRRTGRPYVVLKLAATLDGRIAAPDGTSRWLTSAVARADAHELRADSDAILVGAGTVRSDDPALTVRLEDERLPRREPLRVVLGSIPPGAKVLPALEREGELVAILEELASLGVLQLLVEGGAHVAHDFHAQRLVDRYVLYLAPALFGGDDARPAFAGPGAASLAELFRGELVSVRVVGDDLRVDLTPPRPTVDPTKSH